MKRPTNEYVFLVINENLLIVCLIIFFNVLYLCSFWVPQISVSDLMNINEMLYLLCACLFVDWFAHIGLSIFL